MFSTVMILRQVKRRGFAPCALPIARKKIKRKLALLTPDTDAAVNLEGYISVTPMRADLTAHDALDALREIE